MASVYFCDGGCGAASPDRKTKLYVENGWLRVRFGKNSGFDSLSKYEDKLFCDKCAKAVKSAINGALDA